MTMTSYEIRENFLEFFRKKDHVIVPSSPIVVKNDPTLMFTNAGMNQFKDIFLDIQKPKYKRVADTQKCLRVSGKHNDLEEVGLDHYHHTMFEMLGNWSFGDYFKNEAIHWAFELLTEVYGIDKNNLYATYFEGDNDENLNEDLEAKEVWLQLLPADHVLPGNKKDNFWEMGNVGPCGPCSEIHIDLRDIEEKNKINGATLVNKSHPEVIELWNLVFIQYNRNADGSLALLPHKHVDTGMGLERLTRVLQNVNSNYDTDLFQPLIKKIEQLAGIPYKVDSQKDIAFRVIADHVRAVSCAIADGQLPSNIKAGYVIRRILRRAIRYGYQYLNITEPFIYKISQTFIEHYHKIFPELKDQADLIVKVINQEEITFLATLERGIKLFDQYIENHKNTKIIDGEFAFELYDTYGFPIDLTQLMAKEKGLEVDITKFEEFLNQQRQRSRLSAQIDTEDWVIIKDADSEFVGYDTLECPAQIIKYRKIVQKNKTFYHLVLDKTPFYAESGGQVGDTGIIYSANETITIINTIKEYGQIIHISDKIPQDLQSMFTAKVDIEKRLSTMRNHSATHLLHYALRQLLGQHVEQKGSLVHPDYLRFDFSHYEKISLEQLNEIEKLVNKLIQNNYPLEEHRDIPYQQAINMGAMALFGEKYGDHVRLIKFGDSKELCGGTHVKATGDIGCFKIINETAVASGIRRIEAVTGMKAIETFQETFNIISQIKNILKTNNPLESVENLIEKNKELTKQNDDLLKEKLNNIARNLIENAEKINDFFFIGEILDLSPDQLRQLSFIFKTYNKNIVAVIAANKSDKANVSFVIADEVIKKYNFNTKDLINIAAPIINGKGGGQPNMAIMGGENKGNYLTLIKEVKKFIIEKSK